jgi:uncharacterized protein YgfB (UPF0149 family)
MLSVTYDELEAALAAGDATIAAGEAHGSLCGALAAGAGDGFDVWVETLLPGSADEAGELRSRNLLETLHQETAAALAGQEMDFAPLLPGDEAALERRVAALAEWCGGFLYGLGTALPAADALPEGVGEVLRDFGEISRAVLGGEQSEESNEESYAELVEYLRVSAQLVYEELAPHRAAAGAQ